MIVNSALILHLAIRILPNLLELYAPLNMYLASLDAHTNYALCGLDLHNRELEVIISKFKSDFLGSIIIYI